MAIPDEAYVYPSDDYRDLYSRKGKFRSNRLPVIDAELRGSALRFMNSHEGLGVPPNA